jgi:hypothetical protein
VTGAAILRACPGDVAVVTVSERPGPFSSLHLSAIAERMRRAFPRGVTVLVVEEGFLRCHAFPPPPDAPGGVADPAGLYRAGFRRAVEAIRGLSRPPHSPGEAPHEV